MKNNTAFSFLLTASLIVFAMNSHSKVREYETTRLKSTGGAGVGSILMNESAILNPAPIAFFSNSSVYYQKESYAYEGGTISQRGLRNSYEEYSDSQGVIVADTKKHLKGAVAYTKQQEGYDKRERLSASLASVIGEKSSMGFLYRKTEDDTYDFQNEDGILQKYEQLVIGVTHLIDESFSLGAVAIDPFQTVNGDTKAILGSQYIYKGILTLMLDIGADYTEDLAASRLYRAAVQFNAFSSFFLRAGVFEDRVLDERGSGFGLAWVGPKLVVEGGVKNINDLGLKEDEVPSSDRITETSFSLSYFF